MFLMFALALLKTLKWMKLSRYYKTFGEWIILSSAFRVSFLVYFFFRYFRERVRARYCLKEQSVFGKL